MDHGKNCEFYFSPLVWYPQTSVLSTAKTHTGGDAVLGKPGGSLARRQSRNIVLKETFAYADIHTKEEHNRHAQ